MAVVDRSRSASHAPLPASRFPMVTLMISSIVVSLYAFGRSGVTKGESGPTAVSPRSALKRMMAKRSYASDGYHRQSPGQREGVASEKRRKVGWVVEREC